MRARVCVLAVVVPRLMMVVKERSSFLDSLIGCAVLAMFKRYRKRASLPINLNYRVLRTMAVGKILVSLSVKLTVHPGSVTLSCFGQQTIFLQ